MRINWRTKVAHFIIIGFVIGLALIPIINIVHIVSTIGADNLSNDYMRTVALVDKIFSGSFDWRNYFQDTFIVNKLHSYAFFFLVQLGLIKLTGWSVYGEIYVGLILAAIRLVFVKSIIFKGRRGFSVGTLLMWPILSALVFSNSQITVFTFGETALQQGLTQLGIVIGIFSLLTIPDTWLSIFLLFFSGVIASFSGGGGLLAWPIYLIGLILVAPRWKWVYGVTWSLGAIISFLPYFLYGYLGDIFRSIFVGGFHPQGLNPEFFITALGYPFANGIGIGGLSHHSSAEFIGILGLSILLLFIAFFIFTRPRISLKPMAGPLLFVAWGLFSAGQFSISRLYLAPWYVTALLPFWIGLIGLAFYLLPFNPISAATQRFGPLLQSFKFFLILTVFLVITIAYALTNLTYEDKSFYLDSRRPVSAACLRHYINAPTYCEGFLFQWGIGHPDYLYKLAQPLEKYQLSVFRPIQEWSMQGESIFETVYAQKNNVNLPVKWVDDAGQNSSWLAKEKLNLKLQSDEEVRWEINLPEDASKILFKTAIKVDAIKAKDQAVTVNISIQPGLQTSRITVFVQRVTSNSANWLPISIDISGLKGERVTLFLESGSILQNGENNVEASVQFQFPVLEIHTPIKKPEAGEPVVKPGNVDLITEDFLIENQLSLAPLPGLDGWKLNGFTRMDTFTLEWANNDGKYIDLQSPIDLCLHDYTHFYFQMSLPASYLPRYVQVFFLVGDQVDFTYNFGVPLVSDGNMHSYTLSLDIFNFPPSQVLKNIRLSPVFRQGNDKSGQLLITGMGFLKKNGSVSCEK
jgi:hypothetical protein